MTSPDTAFIAVRRASAGSFELLGETATPPYRDTQFEFGQTYYYQVRAVFGKPGHLAMSDASPAVKVTPRDIFPASPAAGIVEHLLGGRGGTGVDGQHRSRFGGVQCLSPGRSNRPAGEQGTRAHAHFPRCDRRATEGPSPTMSPPLTFPATRARRRRRRSGNEIEDRVKG